MTDETPSPWYRINTRLLPVKGIYFLWVAALGVLLPFIPIYMKQLGLSSTEVGFMYGVMPFISFFVRPIFGAIADKTRRPKLVMITCMLLTGLCYILLLKAPPKQNKLHVLQEHSVVLNCGKTSSFVKICKPRSFTLPAQNYSKSLENSISTPSLTSYSTEISRNRSNTLSSNTYIALTQCKTSCNSNLSTNVELSTGENSLFNDTCSLSDTSIHVEIEIKTESSAEEVASDGSDGTVICDEYQVRNIKVNGNIYTNMICEAGAIFDCSLRNELADSKESQSKTRTSTFLIYFVIYLFCNIFYAPVLSLIDATAYDILADKRRHWGRQRVWGTIGYMSFGVTSTYLMDVFSDSADDINYSISFYIFTVLCVCSAIVTYLIQISDTLQSQKMLKNIKELFKYSELVVFLIVVTVFGILNSVVEAFLFWFLKDLGSSQIVLGLCLLFNGLPGIIMLYFAGSIMKRIGEVPCLYLGALAYTIQFFSYSFINNPWYVLPVELLHCLTYGLFYAAASAYGSRITPSGMSGTVQGMIGGLYFGFGKGVGSLVTGKLLEPETGLGSRWTFRFYGFVSIALLVSYASIQATCFRKSKEPFTVQTELTVVDIKDGECPPTESLLVKDTPITDTDTEITDANKQIV